MDRVNPILEEICKAAERLGGDGERIRTLSRGRIYDALEDLEADRFVLAIVGSWGRHAERRPSAGGSPALERRRAAVRLRHREYERKVNRSECSPEGVVQIG